MKLSRDSWLAIGLLVIIVLITIAAGIQEGRKAEMPALTSISSAPNGALALRLWLEGLGYKIAEPELTTFNISDDIDIAFILEPIYFESENELILVKDWVEKGGTLIAAGKGVGSSQLAEAFGWGLGFDFNSEIQPVSQTPLLDSPPQASAVNFEGNSHFSSPGNSDFVTLLATDSQPVVVMFDYGKGRVILAADATPFTNTGLKETGNASLVLNLLGFARKNDLVWFDDWHHNLRTGTQVIGPEAWLKSTPAGRSLLLFVAIVFLSLLLGGQAFGRPIPQVAETRRRGIMDYITAVANLNRRAKHRKAVLQYYHRMLKRHFGKRYRMDTSMPDEQFVAQLEQFNPALDGKALLALLAKLRRDASEQEMVALAALVAEMMEK